MEFRCCPSEDLGIAWREPMPNKEESSEPALRAEPNRQPCEGLGEWLQRLDRDYGIKTIEYVRAPDRLMREPEHGEGDAAAQVGSGVQPTVPPAGRR